jgi:hypothetical protein
MAKHKGKAKSAELSKKERKALKAREAELLAKLEARAAKKAKPATEVGAGAVETAKAAIAEAGPDATNDDIKARVKAKRERRALLDTHEYRETVDRNDAEAVAAYNAEAASLGLNHFLTSAAEIAKALAGPDDAAPAKVKKTKADKTLEAKVNAAIAEVQPQTAEVIETETGREFAVGDAPADDDGIVFAKPSEAPAQLEAGGKGYKIIAIGADGKPDPKTVRQLTRVTTYIANLEDKTNLELWKLRTLLEGTVIASRPDDDGDVDDPLGAIASHMHVRDVALAKAAKDDRKGKLDVGEVGRLQYAAGKAFKDAVNVIANELLEIGGVHEKANRGTNLHALTELVDNGQNLPGGDEVSATDRASVAAYTAALEAAGIKVVAAETVVVNDAVRYAGRLDRIVMYRPEGAQRAKRCVADIKTGRIDYGFTKIEQQVAMYADGEGYDLETGERTPLRVDKHLGLLIHMPQGEGTVTIYELDLDRGRRGNKLSGQVRAWRAESGRVKPETAPKVVTA